MIDSMRLVWSIALTLIYSGMYVEIMGNRMSCKTWMIIMPFLPVVYHFLCEKYFPDIYDGIVFFLLLSVIMTVVGLFLSIMNRRINYSDLKANETDEV